MDELGNLIREHMLKKYGEDEFSKIMRVAKGKIKQKNAGVRFKLYVVELNKFLSSGFKAVSGSTQQEMIRDLLNLVDHTERLWDDAVELFNKASFATACFLSLVCIEECAKINFGFWQMFQFPFTSSSSSESSSFSPSAPPKHQKNPLAVHKKKHFVAACAGALVNSRMDRILGMERVKEFLAICDKGLLEQLRQSCLYSDIGPAGNMLLPNEKIDKAQSLFYVSLAGEILAEVGGVEPITWDKLLEKVSKFENENGMAE